MINQTLIAILPDGTVGLSAQGQKITVPRGQSVTFTFKVTTPGGVNVIMPNNSLLFTMSAEQTPATVLLSKIPTISAPGIATLSLVPADTLLTPGRYLFDLWYNNPAGHATLTGNYNQIIPTSPFTLTIGL